MEFGHTLRTIPTPNRLDHNTMIDSSGYQPSPEQTLGLKQIESWWWPQDELHLPQMLINGQYQWRTQQAFVQGLDGQGTCIDVGANVGLWSRGLAQRFSRVVAYEPIEEFRRAFMLNVTEPTALLCGLALGDQEQEIHMVRTLGNGGHTHRDDQAGRRKVQQRRLDQESWQDVQAIKIDVEGWEYEVLLGAEQTIQASRPRICIEQKPHRSPGQQYLARDLLLKWGYRVQERIKDDWIMCYDH